VRRLRDPPARAALLPDVGRRIGAAPERPTHDRIAAYRRCTREDERAAQARTPRG